MNNQRFLERKLVDELRIGGNLEEVISSYCIESIRVCCHCGKLMNEGWMYGGYETFCSDKCLLSEHPDEDIKKLKEHASNDGSNTYWSEWE